MPRPRHGLRAAPLALRRLQSFEQLRLAPLGRQPLGSQPLLGECNEEASESDVPRGGPAVLRQGIAANGATPDVLACSQLWYAER